MQEQDKNKHITIALCAYNAESTIEKSIICLLKQTHKNLNLYVVDDASTDKTKSIVQNLLPQDPRLHLISLRENVGTYSCKNLILRDFCQSPYFAHQDADDYSWPKRLEKQLAFLESSPHVAACGVGIDEFYQEKENAPQIPSEFESSFDPNDNCYHRKNLYAPLIPRGSCFHDSIDELSKLKIAMNGSILFRTNALKRLGGFDGRTRVAGDTDMLWRLLVHYDFANIQEILYSRYFHEASLTQSSTLGFKSDYRIHYIQKVFDDLKEIKNTFDVKDEKILLERTKRDLFVPEVEIQLYELVKEKV